MPCVVESFPLRGGRRQTGVAMPAAAGRARMRSAAAAHQSSQQPDLPGVVNIVRCDPIELRQELFAARGFQHLGDRRAQRLVLALEQFLVRLPRCFTQIPVLWPGKEFTAWVRNRAALTLFNPPPYCVLPVCRVQGFFPDIVSPGSGTPSRLLRGQAAYRLFEIRSMPRALFVGFIEQRKDQLRRFHGTPGSEKHPKVRCPGGWRVVTWVSTERACVRGGRDLAGRRAVGPRGSLPLVEPLVCNLEKLLCRPPVVRVRTGADAYRQRWLFRFIPQGAHHPSGGQPAHSGVRIEQ